MNLNLMLQLNANTGPLTQALNGARSNFNAFTQHISAGARSMGTSMTGLYQQMNGLSAISKLAVAAGGYSILSDAMRRNLEFEKTLLNMKQTAEMTITQSAEMRRIALDTADRNMALPSEMVEGMEKFSAAGMRFTDIKNAIDESARSAVAFRATVAQMANLDFDLQEKMKLDPSQIKAAHNMLLYHAKSGRYEAAPMASEAPKYLNSVAGVGITGIKGLNFTGALTQVLMKLAPATQPAEVATFMEHGLGHITAKHQVHGLEKFGIDVKKYMPNGKFYGEGGVQGALDLAQEMKNKGLDNPFKLDKAGFREMYTKKFWRQMMDYGDDIKRAIKEGEKAASDDMVGRDKAEAMGSNYGRLKQLAIAKEKAQLSDPTTGVITKTAAAAAWATENPKTAIAGGIAAAVAAKLALNVAKNKLISRVPPKVVALFGGDGNRVFVTNWPDCICGGGAKKMIGDLPRVPPTAVNLAKVGAGAVAATAGVSTAATIAIGASLVAFPAAILLGMRAYWASKTGHRTEAARKGVELDQIDRRINWAKNAGDTELLTKLQTQRAALASQQQTELAAAAPSNEDRVANLKRTMDKLEQQIALAKLEGRSAAVPNLVAQHGAAQQTAATAVEVNTARVNAELAKLDAKIAATRATTTAKPENAAIADQYQKDRDNLNQTMNSLIQELRVLAERPIQVNLDSRPIADAVNKANGRDARRQ